MDFRCSPNNIDPIIRGDSAGNKILAGAYRILAVWNCIPTVSLRLPGRSATPPAQFLEAPERHQKIHAVASEPADGLGIDHIDLAHLTVGQEALESRSGADGPSRLDIGIGSNIFPSRVLQDILFLEIHLG